MPTLSLPFPSLLTSPLSSYFLPTTTTTSSPPQPPPPPPLDTKPTATKPPTDNTTTTLELRRVFEMFDHNGDGRITMGELTSSLENMGILIPEPELARMIARIDADGDGCLDGAEFEALYRLITEERDTTTGRSGEEDDEDHDLREAFSVFDKNGDGFITVDELRAVLGSFGPRSGRTLEECKAMIMKVDVDGDGRVSFLEFQKMMKEGCFGALS